MPQELKNLYTGFVVAAPGANTDIISGGIDIGAKAPGIATIRIQIVLVSGTSSVVRLTRTVAGVTRIESLNNGVAVTAACTTAWDVMVDPAETINLQLVTNAIINSLKVSGVYMAVA